MGSDIGGRLKSVSLGDTGVIYKYQPNSSRVGQMVFTNAVGTIFSVTNTFDGVGRVLTKTSTTGQSCSYAYNSRGVRTGVELDNDREWDWQYDSRAQLTNAVYSVDSTPVAGLDLGFVYDLIGNRTKTSVDDTEYDWTANLLNQVTSRDVPQSVFVRGEVDSALALLVNGQSVNRGGKDRFDVSVAADSSTTALWKNLRVVAADIAAEEAQVRSGNLFVPLDPESFQFDNDGNMTQDGRFTYTWNGENRLIQVETRTGLPAGVPRQKIEFTYDSQGRRRTKKVSDWNGSTYALTREHEFFYDGWNLIEERITEGAATTVNRFVWGLDLSGSLQGAGGVGGLVMMELDGEVYFPVFDGNGNIVALIDDAGAVAAEYDYGPFGEALRMSGPVAAANPFRFSTKYFDVETGLSYYGYRYYSPELGRWLNRDPIGERGGVGLASFVANCPISNVDVFGLWMVHRDGLPLALAITERGDSLWDLAQIIGLDALDTAKWLTLNGVSATIRTVDGRAKRLEDIRPLDNDRLCPGQTVWIPNTIYSVFVGKKQADITWSTFDATNSGLEALGFRVISVRGRGSWGWDGETVNEEDYLGQLESLSAAKVLQGVFEDAHGGSYGFSGKSFNMLFRDMNRRLQYKLGVVMLYSCFGLGADLDGDTGATLGSSSMGGVIVGAVGKFIPQIDEINLSVLFSNSKQGTHSLPDYPNYWEW